MKLINDIILKYLKADIYIICDNTGTNGTQIDYKISSEKIAVNNYVLKHYITTLHFIALVKSKI